MKVIHKHDISTLRPTEVWLHHDAKIVHVARQEAAPGDTIQLWEQHEVGGSYKAPRTFEVYGTGHNMPDNAAHVGTVMLYGDTLVLHVVEIKGSEALS